MIYLPDSNAWIAYLRQNNPREFGRVPGLKLEDWQ